LEKPVAILIGIIGLLVLADVNPFKRLQVGLSTKRRKGLWSGAVLGASLGLVWIPCVGPSSALSWLWSQPEPSWAKALPCSNLQLGLGLPMLVAGYASQFFREKTAILRSRPMLVRIASGALLVGLSVWILTKGLYSTPCELL